MKAPVKATVKATALALVVALLVVLLDRLRLAVDLRAEENHGSIALATSRLLNPST